MRLVVSKYQRDEQQSLDCHFCPDEKQGDHWTIVTFYAEETGQVMNMCPEHLDEAVSAALVRQRQALETDNPMWYLDEDKDPWEDLG